MAEFEEMVISGSSIKEFFKSYSQVQQVLSVEVRRRLVEIVKAYAGAHGFEGVYERMNHRTIAQIFAEYQPTRREPIESGEVDGMRWRL